MKVVLDANVVVAGFMAPGTCRQVYDAGRMGHVLIRSDRLIEEVRHVLRDRMHQPQDRVDGALGDFVASSESAVPLALPTGACRDSDDLHVLGLAAAVGADLIVTGDKDLLVLGSFRGCEILRPAEALRRLLPPTLARPGGGAGIAAERAPRYGRPRKRKR